MKLSSAVQASILLSLTAPCFAQDASRQRITDRTWRTNYRVDTWDDGRDLPYRVTFWKFGLKSVYLFDVAGHVKLLTTRDTTEFNLDVDVGSRMLRVPADEVLEDMGFEFNSLKIACSDCVVTWTTLCDVGLPEVCFLHDNPLEIFNDDAIDSVRRLCSSFGEACRTSGSETCDGQCSGVLPPPEPTEPTPAPIAMTTLAPVDVGTLAPVAVATPSPVVDSTPAPMVAATPAPMTAATLAPVSVGTPAPVMAETPAPVMAGTPAPVMAATPAPVADVMTPAPVTEVTPAPITEATPAPVIAATPAPTPSPVQPEGVCNPNPCENGGSCTADPAGGHVCSCAANFGGMTCQTDTSSLSPFFIEIDFIGTWTPSRRAVFQSAADRWSEVITHVPCGGTTDFPGGRLLIESTLEEIDGVGMTLGSAGPGSVWNACNTISAEGSMRFDIADIDRLEADGSFEGVILHEMGHVIGVGTLWGDSFGECTTCRQTGNPAWTCPAAVSAFADLGGSGADIVELDGEVGTSCAHFDEVIFVDELMTGFVDNPMFLSKMTAAVLDDLNYIVDPSAVDAYILPSERGGALVEDAVDLAVTDTAVDAVINLLDEEGDVIRQVIGVGMEF